MCPLRDHNENENDANGYEKEYALYKKRMSMRPRKPIMSTSKNLDYVLHPDDKQTDQEHTQSQSANMCRRCCTETLQPPKKKGLSVCKSNPIRTTNKTENPSKDALGKTDKRLD